MACDISALSEVVRRVLNQQEASRYDPWFQGYCGSLRDSRKLQRYVRHLSHMFSLGSIEIKGKSVLDAGCGFGMTCLACYFMGASEVHGVDIYGGMIKTFQTYLSELMPGSPIFAKVNNVAKLDYDDNTFDILLAIEAISHFHDLPGFFKEAHRVLRKGGVLLVSDGNNACNPFVVHKTRKVWNRFENGSPPKGTSQCALPKPYLMIRQEIIQQSLPNLSPHEVSALAKGTFGKTKDEVIDACRRFSHEGVLPVRNKGRLECPVDPIGQVYMERLLNPFELKKHLDRIGFDVGVYAYLGGARAGLATWLDQGLRPLGRLLIYLAGSYKIVARKR